MKNKSNEKSKYSGMNWYDLTTIASNYSSKVLFTDKRFEHSVTVITEDMGVFIYQSAFIVEIDEDYFFVVSEHDGFRLFDKGAVHTYKQYKEVNKFSKI